MTRNKLTLLFTLSFGLLLAQCSEEVSGPNVTPGSGPGANPGNPPSPDWLIPQGSVFDGGPGKDGIPAISNPQFIPNFGFNLYMADFK